MGKPVAQHICQWNTSCKQKNGDVLISDSPFILLCAGFLLVKKGADPISLLTWNAVFKEKGQRTLLQGWHCSDTHPKTDALLRLSWKPSQQTKSPGMYLEVFIVHFWLLKLSKEPSLFAHVSLIGWGARLECLFTTWCKVPLQEDKNQLCHAVPLQSHLPARREARLIKLLPTILPCPGNCTNHELMRNNEPAHRGRKDNSEQQQRELMGKYVLIAHCWQETPNIIKQEMLNCYVKAAATIRQCDDLTKDPTISLCIFPA